MRGALAGAFLAGLLFLAGMLTGHYVWSGPPTYVVAKERVPVIVRETETIREAPRRIVTRERCAKLTEIADPDILAEYARRFGLPDLSPDSEAPASLLTAGMIPRTRWGGEAAVTLHEGEDRPRITFVPSEPPTFDLRSDWSLRVGPAYVAGEDGSGLGGLIELDWRFAQTKTIDHGLTLVGVASADNPAAAIAYTVGFGSH